MFFKKNKDTEILKLKAIISELKDENTDLKNKIFRHDWAFTRDITPNEIMKVLEEMASYQEKAMGLISCGYIVDDEIPMEALSVDKLRAMSKLNQLREGFEKRLVDSGIYLRRITREKL